MRLNIVTYPDKTLRKKNEEVKEVDQDIKNLALDMIETMHGANGAGIAAPQVGVNKKIIIVNWQKEDYVFINPRIIKKSFLKYTDKEGCLSFPGLEIMVKRPKKITVKAIDYSGKSIEIIADGMFARILQHEIDHIEGNLLIDFASKKGKDEYKKSLN
jgi:peptide deformylase